MAVTKRRLHHVLVVLRRISFWQILVLAVVMFCITIFFLRQNNLEMVRLRNLVKVADQQNGNTAQALRNLQDFVMHHMNTDMGSKGIYLQVAYQNAYNRAVQQAESAGSQSSAIYAEADRECQQLFSKTASFSAYVQCVTNKISADGSATDPLSAIKAPSTDLFRYNFVSPAWSPDIAGFCAVITALLFIFILGRVLMMGILYGVVRRRHR